MLAPGQQMTITLKLPEKAGEEKRIKNRENRGKLTVKADKIRKTQDLIKFQISADLRSQKFLCIGQDAPQVVIERAKQMDDKESFVVAWRSHIAHDEIKPWWEPTQLHMNVFCNNDKELPLRITVNNQRGNSQSNQKIYGFVETTTNEIEMLGTSAPIPIKNENGKVKGQLYFN